MKLKYIKEFDSLRAIAVISVMFQHYLGQYKLLSVFGSSGVILFFVLSGVLITQILIKEKDNLDITYSNKRLKIGNVLKVFYLRRSLRIFPIYYITLLILVILNIDSARHYWAFHFFYLSNFLYSFFSGFDRLAHFWSLAVEEQFYLVWPLIILLLPVNIKRTTFFGMLIVASLVFKFLIISIFPNNYAYVFLMPACIEAFAAGALVVEFLNKEISVRKSLIFMIGCLCVFISLQLLSVFYPSTLLEILSKLFSRTLISASAASLLLIIAKGVNMGIISWILLLKPLRYLGKISYGIYIYHMFVPTIQKSIAQTFKLNLSGSGLNLILHFVITFLIAHISYILIEKPFNALKSRFGYQIS